MVTYKVVSTQTSYYIISTGGERAGDAVQTRNPHQGYTDAVRALRQLSFVIVDNISYPRT